jgi:hypothetical protein
MQQQPYPQQQNGGMNVEQLQQTALNVIEALCGIICMPVEIILRPQYGTRYFPVPVVFFSAVLMILLPAFSAMATGVTRMIPFARVSAPVGLFGIGSLAKLYFFLSFFHGIRLWRRMIHMELEAHSQFEGPPLPFFRLIPKSWWFTRIVLEPAFVFVVSTILTNMLIFQSGLSVYLHIAALALLMKSFIRWFREWEFLRNLLDLENAAPIVSKLLHGETTTQEERSQVHLAGFPKHVEPRIKQAALQRIANLFSLNIPPTEESTLGR